MFTDYSSRAVGIVDQTEDGRIETEILHWYWVPFLPTQSFAVTADSRVGIPLHRRSVAVGFGEIWLLHLLVAMGIAGFAIMTDVLIAPGWVLPTLLAAMAAVGFAWRQCLTAHETAPFRRCELEAYARVTGAPFDPVEMGSDLDALTRRVEKHLRRALPLASRVPPGAPPTAQWLMGIAETRSDSKTLANAVTLARIAICRAPRPERAGLRRAHKKLCERFAGSDER